MIVKFIGRRSYYAHPFLFTEKERIQDVESKLGKYLLSTGYFEEVKDDTKHEEEKNSEIKEDTEIEDLETQEEIEEKESKQKEFFEETKKEIKKKSTKKDENK
jgi:hypothetical protein